MWEKHGFTRILEEPLGPQPMKGQWQYHYRLTRRDFIGRRRVKVPPEKQFTLPISELRPSQLFISEGKLRLVREWFNPDGAIGMNPDRLNAFNPDCAIGFDPIPVIRMCGKIQMTDGHTRAVAAYLAGWDRVPVYWDEDGLDLRAYAIDMEWCEDEGIFSPADLAGRIVPHMEYERLWRKRCMEMTLGGKPPTIKKDA
jgi:hypothetical protein